MYETFFNLRERPFDLDVNNPTTAMPAAVDAGKRDP